MQAANALRETFKEKDYIRFHPIITAGGDAVNAIPDNVKVESYVRGATMEAITKENIKVNRAFVGAAVSMGCKLVLKDEHGYAPRFNDPIMKEACREIAMTLVPEEDVNFGDGWGTGCSDMGDVCCIMPGIHPNAGGATGAGHSSEYYITDPYTACVISAKLQAGTVANLLCNGAEKATRVRAEGRQDYPTPTDYLAMIDKNSFDGQTVIYNEDGSIELKFTN